MYIYIALIFVLSIIAIIVQCMFKPKVRTEEEQEDLDAKEEAAKLISKYKSLDK